MHEVEQQEVVKGLALLRVGPGTKAIGLLDGKVIVTIWPVGRSGPCQRSTLPPPPGGRVVDLDWGGDGPIAGTANGTISCWSEIEQRWRRLGSLVDEARR